MNDILAVFKIKFDYSRGPVVEWKKQSENGESLNFEDFIVNFYVNFMGGNKKPIALLFQDFDVLAFSKGLDLLTIFLDKSIEIDNYEKYARTAKKLIENGKEAIWIEDEEIPQVSEKAIAIELVLGEIGRVPYSVLKGLVDNSIATAQDYINAYDSGTVPIDKIKGLGPKRTELIYAACRRHV